MASENNLHSGHRSRMKEKYLRFGSDVFSDHELLEILLFHSIPRIDTNATAHELIEKLGSLENVMFSDVEMLRTVDGVGESSALLISLIGDIYSRIDKKPLNKKKKYRTLTDVGEFLVSHYSGARKEYFSALYFNSSMELIDVVVLSEGSASEAAVTPSRIAREAILKDASGVIIAHNHLGDSPLISHADRNLTNLVEATLSAVGIPLIEHVVVSQAGYAPSMHLRSGTPASTLGTQAFGDDFFTRFYKTR